MRYLLITLENGITIHINNQYLRLFDKDKETEKSKLIFKKDITYLLDLCVDIPYYIYNIINNNKSEEDLIYYDIDLYNTKLDIGFDKSDNFFHLEISRGKKSIIYADFDKEDLMLLKTD